MRLFVSVVALLALPVALSAGQTDAPAKPKWSIDGAGAQCTLTRVLEGAPASTLVVRAYPGTYEVEFMLVSKAWPASKIGPGRDLAVTLNPAGSAGVRPVQVVSLGSATGKAVAMDHLSNAFLNDLAGATSLSVVSSGKPVGTFRVPDTTTKAIAAFRACGTAKLIEWGADPAAFEPGGTTVSPKGNTSQWIAYEDLRLPHAAGNFAALAVARLAIGTDGRVESCSLIASNGNSSLNEKACSLLTSRAQYEPARDKDGKPVRSVAVYRAEWTVNNTVTYQVIRG